MQTSILVRVVLSELGYCVFILSFKLATKKAKKYNSYLRLFNTGIDGKTST